MNAQCDYGNVEILRDDYGVPHIQGDSLASAMFAHGYCQAEDRIADIMKNCLRAEGRLAEFFAEQFVVDDLTFRHHLNPHAVDRGLAALDTEVLACLQAFSAGVDRAVEEGTAAMPVYGEPMTPRRALCLSMWLSTWWSFLKSEEGRNADTAVSHFRPIGSSGVIVGKSRTADGSVLATIDPHVNYWEMWNFYEVHLSAPALHVFGYTLCGLPFVTFGHTEGVSWTPTMGSSDICTVYEVKLDPADPSKYLFDGQSRPFDRRNVSIKARVNGSAARAGDGEQAPVLRLRTVEREVLDTVHGPVLRTEGDRAVAVHYPTRGDAGLLETLLAMNRANSAGELAEALRGLSYLNVNLYIADRDGTVWLLTFARAPVRPRKRVTGERLPGWRSDMLVRGHLAIEQLPQVRNPEEDFVENRDGLLDLVAWDGAPPLPCEPPELPERVTNQGACGGGWPPIKRGILDHPRMTPRDLMAIYMDVRVDGIRPWQDAIRGAWERHGAGAGDDARALCEHIVRWDGMADHVSLGASAMRAWAFTYATLLSKDLDIAAWNHYCSQNVDSMPPQALIREPATDEEMRAAAQAVEGAATFLKAHFGSVSVPWGDMQRYPRGALSLPVEGFCVEGLPFSPRIVLSRPGADGRFHAWAGNSATTVVQLGDRTRSWAHRPNGQSEDPHSPHYADQVEMFCRRAFRPTWFQREDLEGHISRRVVFPRRDG